MCVLRSFYQHLNKWFSYFRTDSRAGVPCTMVVIRDKSEEIHAYHKGPLGSKYVVDPCIRTCDLAWSSH